MMLASTCSGSGGVCSTMIVTSVVWGVVQAVVPRSSRVTLCDANVGSPEWMLVRIGGRRSGQQSEPLREVHGGRPVADLEAPVDQRRVVLDGVDRQPERVCDALVGRA